MDFLTAVYDVVLAGAIAYFGCAFVGGLVGRKASVDVLTVDADVDLDRYVDESLERLGAIESDYSEDGWEEPIEMLVVEDLIVPFRRRVLTVLTEVAIDYSAMTVKELRRMCRDRKVAAKLWKSARKEVLIGLLA